MVVVNLWPYLCQWLVGLPCVQLLDQQSKDRVSLCESL